MSASNPRSRSAPAEPTTPAADDLGARPSSDERFAMTYGLPSGSVSFVTHLLLILLLAFITSSGHRPDQSATNIVSSPAPVESEVVEFLEKQIEAIDVTTPPTPDRPDPTNIDPPTPEIVEAGDFNDQLATASITEIDLLGERTIPKGQTLERLPGSGETLGDRRNPNRRKGIFGATDDSEKAVARALAWLAAHQNADGSWSFDHRGGACQGRCRNHGSLADARIGATGMALLPFLGAGQTHREGQYKDVVKKGISYLLTKMRVQAGQSGDLMEGGGNMYSHGLASIVLCEAYAMTHDKLLLQPAQLAINHIVAAQDPVGGGWRYQMKQPGDTSVVGWQLMALKSGHLAYLNVPPATVKLTTTFLDSVQAESGSQYGYTGPATGRDATTAIGLLCRMLLGWKRDHPALTAGVKYLAERGPSKTNLYYNYYATQVLHHYSGEDWKKWNAVLRDQLVAAQAKAGHEEGSWHLAGGDHGADSGGRLYCTAMSTMILEVYYRHLPIYGKQASEDDFRL